MARDEDARALIVGAGPSGLTAAVALRRRGIDALVFERSDDLGRLQAGSGLGLGYNVARAFRHIGLLDELTASAARITRFEYTTDRGRKIGNMPVAEDELQLGVVRSALHQVLLAAVGDSAVQPGKDFTRFEQDASGVTAEFADGSSARGQVLIGADGLNSTVRAQIHGQAEPRYAGYVTRRGTLESDRADQGLFQMVLGRGERFFHYPVGPGLMYWTAVTDEPQGQSEDPAELKRFVLERFGGWADPIPSLVERTDPSHTFRAEIYDRDPIERWGEGRVTLLGDAAHPMTFNMGQGAGQGIESAVFLARHLSEEGDPATALKAYEADRTARTKRFVELSRRLGVIMQWRNPLACFLRNNVMIRAVSSERGARKGAKDLQVEF